MSESSSIDNEFARVVREIAATRYPFVGQTDWPEQYRTLTNVPVRTRGIDAGGETIYPAIVIVDAESDRAVEVGEVAGSFGPESVATWRIAAASTKVHPGSGAPHFFLYVPEGMEGGALQLLTDCDVPFGGLRTYAIDDEGRLHVTPVVTPVDPKDHLVT